MYAFFHFIIRNSAIHDIIQHSYLLYSEFEIHSVIQSRFSFPPLYWQENLSRSFPFGCQAIDLWGLVSSAGLCLCSGTILKLWEEEKGSIFRGPTEERIDQS